MEKGVEYVSGDIAIELYRKRYMLEQAEKAMIEHFNSTPKKGKFYYTISEDELEDIGGTIMRMFSITLSSGAGSYYKKYFPAELKEMGGC